MILNTLHFAFFKLAFLHMDASTNTPPAPAQLAEASAWWSRCSAAWKRAFNEVALQRSSTEPLPDELLLTVFQSPNHRFSGPQAPYPNMSFELEDMSGLTGLPNTELVVVTFHQLRHIQEVKNMPTLRSLFVYNNQITSLDGVEARVELQELYAQCNDITTLTPLEKLVHLKTLYCSHNLLADLAGIGAQHTDQLENFYCLPNPNLKDRMVLAFEREVGIRCRKG